MEHYNYVLYIKRGICIEYIIVYKSHFSQLQVTGQGLNWQANLQNLHSSFIDKIKAFAKKRGGGGDKQLGSAFDPDTIQLFSLSD